MNKNLIDSYEKYYSNYKVNKVYPTEFIVRSFLGNYPILNSIDKKNLFGKKVLDLGCGDGRNIPFLYNLGLDVFGLEISEDILDFCNKNLVFNEAKADLVIGHNSSIPFPNNYFDIIVACHSCYYLNSDDSFEKNLSEIRRVILNGGRFVFSIPTHESYLVKGAEIIDKNVAIIRNDPRNIRNGTKIQFFSSKHEIIDHLESKFENFKIGLSKNNWWGIEEYCWIVVCNAKAF